MNKRLNTWNMKDPLYKTDFFSPLKIIYVARCSDSPQIYSPQSSTVTRISKTIQSQ